jgi:hypothetical protein
VAVTTTKPGNASPPLLALDELGVLSNGETMLTDGRPLKPIRTLQMPDNGRRNLGPPGVCDGSGRTMPVPSICLAILDAEGNAIALTADGVAVPSGAVLMLWELIVAYNQLCAASGPATEHYGRDNGAVVPETAETDDPSAADPVETALATLAEDDLEGETRAEHRAELAAVLNAADRRRDKPASDPRRRRRAGARACGKRCVRGCRPRPRTACGTCRGRCRACPARGNR